MSYSKVALTFYPTSKADHEIVASILSNKHIQYHTYTPQQEKDKKFVIKGLHEVETQDLTQALVSHGVQPKKVTQMKQKHPEKSSSPLYYLAMEPETDVLIVYGIR